MALFTPTTNLGALKGSVIVLTGGSSGIGLALLRQLQAIGAHVWSGDVQAPPSQEACHVTCDVSKYEDICKLFRSAYDEHGHIHHAVACAGVLERGQFFDESLSIEDVKSTPGDQSVLNINLQGTLNFARIASVFLRQGGRQGGSLTFMSSIAGIRDSPGMPLYQTSKVAILGLVRGMRNLPMCQNGRMRVNAICPGMTESSMTSHLIPKFRASGGKGHWQSSQQVAEITAGLMLSDLDGKSLYVEGGKAWEFEDGLKANMNAWLGEVPSTWLRENVELIRGLGGIRKE